jgi:hypothetical protein
VSTMTMRTYKATVRKAHELYVTLNAAGERAGTGRRERLVAPFGPMQASPNGIDAATPAELRNAARLRYGWNDYCESCGVLARECGHRQPAVIRDGLRGRRPAAGIPAEVTSDLGDAVALIRARLEEIAEEDRG